MRTSIQTKRQLTDPDAARTRFAKRLRKQRQPFDKLRAGMF